MLEESRGKRGTGKIMRYRIGEVSELIGVSNEALRNYERAGIIQSWRTEGSNIRYYDIETISKLIGIRSRRNEGFGIKEIQRIYTDISGEEYHALVKEKIAGMERELALRQLYLQRMRWMEEQLSVSERTPNRCVFARSPRFHTLRYREGDCLNSPAVMKVWAQAPLFYPALCAVPVRGFSGERNQLRGLSGPPRRRNWRCWSRKGKRTARR